MRILRNMLTLLSGKVKNKYISLKLKSLLFITVLNYAITKKTRDFPTLIQIQTINACNASCVMCPYSKNKKEKYQIMSDDLFAKIIQEISGVKNITQIHLYLQNEPLLDFRIFDRVKLIKKLKNKNIETCIVSNGSLLNDKKIEQLLLSQNDITSFSIDAFTKKTYEKIRPGLDFDKLIRNIKKINKTQNMKKMSVSFLVQHENYQELNDFKKFWRKKGVNVIVKELTNRAGALKSYNKVRYKKQNISLTKKIKNKILTKTIKNCPFLILSFNILVNGDVILCCNDYNHVMILGNIKESSIKDIWNGEKYKKIRELFYKKRFDEIPICRDCTFIMK